MVAERLGLIPPITYNFDEEKKSKEGRGGARMTNLRSCRVLTSPPEAKLDTTHGVSSHSTMTDSKKKRVTVTHSDSRDVSVNDICKQIPFSSMM
ncbi:hypothetical protein TNCT_220841 [Trichonephila clavata]|uniref:Uncharacterized protein n=1 Tax=Trichonephila clavata TaxID=2740835 RepID=A0A8X6GRY4_TRICU|nr:hypothetical protein TNCT_220841 [Trichonephila clavata]